MDRINTPNTVLKNGKRLFKDGDPTGDIPEQPTTVNAEWLNNVQEEICNVIEGSGANLSHEDNGQLTTAIIKLLENNTKQLLEQNTKKIDDLKKQLFVSKHYESSEAKDVIGSRFKTDGDVVKGFSSKLIYAKSSHKVLGDTVYASIEFQLDNYYYREKSYTIENDTFWSADLIDIPDIPLKYLGLPNAKGKSYGVLIEVDTTIETSRRQGVWINRGYLNFNETNDYPPLSPMPYFEDVGRFFGNLTYPIAEEEKNES